MASSPNRRRRSTLWCSQSPLPYWPAWSSFCSRVHWRRLQRGRRWRTRMLARSPPALPILPLLPPWARLHCLRWRPQQPPRLRNQQRPPPGRSHRRPRLMRFPQSCWLWRRPKYQSSCRSTAATTGATGLTRVGDCQNARNEVLLAERLAAIAYSPDRRCRAASGKWLVPYSGTVVTVLGELDIDPWFPRSTPAVEGSSNGRRSEGGSMPTTSTIPILSSL